MPPRVCGIVVVAVGVVVGVGVGLVLGVGVGVISSAVGEVSKGVGVELEEEDVFTSIFPGPCSLYSFPFTVTSDVPSPDCSMKILVFPS